MTKTPKKSHVLPHGEGSFYYAATKNRWVGSIDAGWNAKGKRDRVTVSDKNEDAAWDKLNAKRKELLLNGRSSTSVSESTTVKQWVDTWLAERKSQVKPKTYRTDAGLLTKWVIPAVGKRRLKDLDAGDFRKIATTMRKPTKDGRHPNGMSETTIGHAHRVFKQCLTDAVSEGHRVPASALAAKKPAPAESDREALSREDALLFRKYSQQVLDGTLWEFLLMTGCRLGEALGLRWRDLDLDRHKAVIRWELQELTRDKVTGDFYVPAKYKSKQLEGRFWLLGPKTTAGIRTVPLPTALCERLKELKDQKRPSKHGLVWSRQNGDPLLEADVRQEFKNIQAQLSIRHSESDRFYTPHELRHTTVSLLLALGVPVAIIEAIVGHSKLVKSYVHIEEAQTAEGIEMYDQSLIEAD